MSKTVHIRNLEKYHPGYKDRDLIWCKVYFKMINSDPEFELLHEIDKWRFVALIMIELQIKKPVPMDPNYLSRKGFDFRSRPMSKTLEMLHELVEVCNAGVTQRREDKEEDKEKREEKRVFRPPDFEELKSFIKESQLTTDPDQFMGYYQATGWMIGKSKMKDWKAAVRNWHLRNNKNEHKKEKAWQIAERLKKERKNEPLQSI